ncbi:NAD(P)H-binding protein [Curtobacterium sp. MCLR17_007]|uniref:NAD-dependent epimerase/dehydratase family protein n=1 Tax=Curtobacterium sp. MCLR17_007 TaxID=2175648 RepID=UPI000DAA96FF|nr:NAD-dependent epimerase/dehydratase family protein [Curtobacterium sp. MCLR17_007]WIB61685.1 NAD(P)H-binding protein [Curtobacterium sp. MCLR17_007]
MTVIIAGCGDLGIATGLRFSAAGHRVVGLRRRAELVPAPLEGRAVDLRQDVPIVDDDTDVVVVALAAGSRDVATYRATYVDGLRNVLDGIASSAAAPRLLVVSSTAVYGGEGDVTESTPATGGTPTADVLLEAEALLRARVPDATLVRLSGIYGPGRERLVDQVRDGAARLAPTPERSRMTNRIHRDDAAAALVHLASLPSPPTTVIGTDDEPVRLDTVTRFIAAELGTEVPAVDDTATPGPDKRLSNALLRSTGFTFSYPTYREGYRAVIAGDGTRHP